MTTFTPSARRPASTTTASSAVAPDLGIVIREPAFAGFNRPLTPGERAVVDQATSYVQTGAERDWRVKTHRWDGRVRLLIEDIFPAGLAPRVADALRREGTRTTITGWEPPEAPLAPITVGWNPEPPLRGYQEDGAAAALDAGRALLEMATGVGKTYTIAAVIAAIGEQALVLVPTKELLHQTAKTLSERLQIKVAKFGDGHDELGPVTVALFQALAPYVDDLRSELARFNVIVSDEAHHQQAATWLKILLAVPARYRFGFSGTFDTDRGEDLLVEALAGPIAYVYSDKQAIADGYLTPPTIMMLKPNTVPVPTTIKDNDFLGVYTFGIVHNEPRNAAFAEGAAMCASTWGKTLVVVKHIEHGEELTERIHALGATSAFLSGKQGSGARRRLMKDFAGTATDVLVATGLLDEGVDIPDISAVALAGAGKAQHKVAQRIGRGMRKGGQGRLVVLDSWDTAHYVLTNHSRERLRLYKKRGWDVEWL